jgi:hypothetical protein
MSTEQELLKKASAYLKRTYGEDTVKVTVLENKVENGSGVLTVDITVSVGGDHSDWRQWFTFKNGNVADMRAKFVS